MREEAYKPGRGQVLENGGNHAVRLKYYLAGIKKAFKYQAEGRQGWVCVLAKSLAIIWVA